MKPLSLRQEAVLLAIRAYWLKEGYGPSLRDIMTACGISSTSVARANVRALAKAGRLRWEPGKARSIREAQKGKEA